MKSIQIIKLSLLLIIIIVFSSTCTTTATQPFQTNPVTSTNIALAEVTSAGTTEYTPRASIDATSTITPTAYLPFVQNPAVKFIGIYLDQYWTKDTVPALQQVDQAAGKKHTSVGWFIDLQNIAFTTRQNDNNGNNFYRQLEALWNNGYISFINVGSALQISNYDVTDNCPIPFSSSQVTSGACDPAIQKMADLYYQWVSQGDGRRAMIAPMQEMNGIWTSYGQLSNSSEYKLAYRHILDIFAQEGVTRDMIWWVFAPNGYNDPDKPDRMFENYYPGDDLVDIVGFSSYNYGYCPDIAPYWRWESYPQIFEPYIARMQVMAPSKPIIIAETASTAYAGVDESNNPVIDYNRMNQWLIDNYNYFANRRGVIGVFYFSFPEFNGLHCAIEINPNGVVLSGYGAGVSTSVYQYLDTTQMDRLINPSR